MTNTTAQFPFGIDTVLDGEQKDKAGCLVQMYPPDGTVGIWKLVREEMCLGRGPECEIRLEHESVSRRHAVVQPYINGRSLLVDLGSTNGTYVNDERVHDHCLSAGDRIRVGTHILKYLSADFIEAQYHETMFKLVTTDGLTEAYNRRYLQDRLTRELDHGGHGRPLSVALMDVDNFKAVNDTYGHMAGDEVLQELSRRAKKVLRENDLFARYGGEEFCAVFLNTDFDKAMVATERTRRQIASRSFVTHAADISVTVSIGFVSTSATLCLDELLGMADAQLYRAKQAGKNCTRGVNR